MTAEYPYIVADIGGTNSRFGLVTGINLVSKRFNIENKQKYPSKSFNSLEQATQHYIQSLGGKKLQGACLAVAGPVEDDNITLTNLDWHFSLESLKKTLALPKLTVINDFAAYAYASQFVAEENLITLNLGKVVKGSPMAIVGPGTGFGVAALVPQQDKWIVLPSEGGHMTLAAKSKLQSSIIDVVSKNVSYVSIETLLSGPGLCLLYQALAQVEGIQTVEIEAAELSKQAHSDDASLSYRTLSLFCKWLGQVTGDLAVALGARNGVYLCGGILKRNTKFLLDSQFMHGFLDKGHMRGYLEQMSVQLVTENDSALVGAAACFSLE